MKRLVLFSLTGGLAAAGLMALRAQPTSQPAANQPAQQAGDPGDILINALKASPGCLGVNACQWQDGRKSIFAWFKDKPSTVAWYNHPVHSYMMRGMGSEPGKALQHVADDAGPIMVIATITESDENLVPGFPISINQVSIELYEVLPGGAMLNGRLAPEGVEIPHMKDFTDAAAGR